MTTMVSPLVEKELRALAPVFIGCASFLVACHYSGLNESTPISVLAYLVGTTSLGALAIGHEFSYGMLDQILAQPTARQRLLRRKLLVLALYLIALAAVAALVIPLVVQPSPGDGSAFDGTIRRVLVVLAPAFLAFGVAPWLSVACRSPLASAVFTLAIYAFLWMVGDYVSPWIGIGDAHHGAVAPGIIVAAAATALLGWRSFMRIEVTGRQTTVAHVVLPRYSRQATSTSAPLGRPLRTLLAKELRLQLMAWLIAALFVATWAVVNGLAPQEAAFFGYITLLYRAFVPVIIGAVATAEERALGTLSWHNVQPCAVRKQWAVKILTALTLTMLLAGAVPSVLETARPSAIGTTWYGVQLLTFGTGFPLNVVLFSAFSMPLALCVMSLYVSSMSRSSLNALLFSLPFAAVFLGLAGLVSVRAYGALVAHIADLADRFSRWANAQPLVMRSGRVGVAGSNWWWWHQEETFLVIHAVLAIGLLVLLLVFAYRNHRSTLIETRIVARQLAWITATVMLVGAASGATHPALSWALMTMLMKGS